MSDAYIVNFSVFDDPEELPREITGVVVNSTYCAVRDKWVLLVNGEDSKLYSIDHDEVSLQCDWEINSDVIVASSIGGPDDEDDDE